MSTDSDKAKLIFLEAVENHASSEWPKLLEERCHGDQELKSRVEALLDAHQQQDSLFDDDETQQPKPMVSSVGKTIGPYKLLQEIGEGGMGVVYMAEQLQPVRRRVALKIIKPGMDTRQVIARFEAERQALALMDHVNIARVLDAGTTETDLPYFVMELVKGTPLTSYCDNNRLTLRERLELFVPVCEALQHAHQKGIIHRDIKPSNVLVCLYDGRPVPKVIDFGVAKAIEQPLTERTMFTQHGQIVGTLEYMSPEQAEMSQLDVDTRSDVYSLGVVLYELLTGSTPITREKLKKHALVEMLMMINEFEPIRPSSRLTESAETLPTISAQRKTEPKKLSLLVKGDLDWIVMKALEKDRTRRYESASNFAADVNRYLDGDAVMAHPPSTLYRARKFARRNRALLVTITAFALVLVAGSAVSTWQAIRASVAEKQSETRLVDAISARQTEKRQRQLAELARDQANHAVIATKQAEEKTRQALTTAKRNLYFNQISLAQRYWMSDQLKRAEQILDDCPEHLRNWEWHYLKKLCNSELISFPGDHAVFSSDGKRLAIVQPAPDQFGVEQILVCDADSYQRLKTIQPAGGGIYKVKFSGNATKIVLVCENSPGRIQGRPRFRKLVQHSIRIFDVATGSETRRMEVGKDVPQDLAVSGDDRLISVATGVANQVQGGLMPEKLTTWNAETGELVWEKMRHGDCLAYHPDGKQLLAVEAVRDKRPPIAGRGPGVDHRRFAILDATNGEVTKQQTSGNVFDATYSPNGKIAAVATFGRVNLFDPQFSSKPERLSHPSNVIALAFSGNSRYLATGDSIGVIRVWNLLKLELVQTFRAHSDGVIELDYRRNGILVSSGRDGTVRVWNTNQNQQWDRFNDNESIGMMAANLEQRRLASFYRRRTLAGFLRTSIGLRNFDSDKRKKRLADIKLSGAWLENAVTMSPDGSLVAAEIDDFTVAVWNSRDGKIIWKLTGHTKPISDMVFDSKSQTLFTCQSGEVRIWDLRTGTSTKKIPTHGDGQLKLNNAKIAISPDDKQLAVTGVGPPMTNTSSNPGGINVLDVKTGQLIRSLPAAHQEPIADVEYSNDGRQLVVAGWDATVSTWEIRTGRSIGQYTGHTDGVTGVTFSRKDKRIVSTGFVGGRPVAKIWDTQSGQEILTIHLPEGIGPTKPFFDQAGHTLGISGHRDLLLLKTQVP